MLLSIQHKTELSYAEPISESVIELRMAPRNDATQTVRSFALAVGPEAPVFEQADWQGNRAHHFSIVEVHDRVEIVASSVVETLTPRQHLDDLSDPLPLNGVGHRLEDFLLPHGPVMKDLRLSTFAEQIGLLAEKRLSTVLAVVTARLRELLKYTKGVTTSGTTVCHALDLGKGVCQDFSHVGLSLLRMLGIPARYVSGYLYRAGSGELETHAWLEAYSPTLGWVGLDPTHGELASESHVAVATGRSYADVPPNRGVYRGQAEEKISVKVLMQRLDNAQEPVPVIVRPEARLLPDRMVRERAFDLQALEQQQQQQQQ